MNYQLIVLIIPYGIEIVFNCRGQLDHYGFNHTLWN